MGDTILASATLCSGKKNVPVRTLTAVMFIGLVFPAGQTALAQSAALDGAEERNWQATCARTLAAPLPSAAAQLAAAAEAENDAAYRECNEQTLYYGFGKAPDYAAALHCAYWHRAHTAVRTAGFLDGAGTLAMLYANGYGVERSYTLAIRFACELDDRAGQNTKERIGLLESLQHAQPPADTRFDLCDLQMSGAMGAYCSDLQGRLNDVSRARRIAAAGDRLPEQARLMLPHLQAAETVFERARIQGEYSGGGGSGSVGFALDDQGRLREQFVINLERFGAGALPKATAADRVLAERELEAAYAAVKAMPVADSKGAYLAGRLPTPEGFAATQDAWQKLIEEWMRFVPVAYPGLSQDAAATELLRLRIHQLKQIAR